jgi:membrane-associated protein
VIGGVAWATGVTLLGFWLGRITFVKENVEMILIGIVILSVLPIAIEVVKARRQNRRTADTGR